MFVTWFPAAAMVSLAPMPSARTVPSGSTRITLELEANSSDKSLMGLFMFLVGDGRLGCRR